jgi:hypothetical protein
VSTGAAACAVCVLWGDDDGGATWSWDNTNWFNGGVVNPAWTNNTLFETNIVSGILGDKTYWYTYALTNALTNVVASPPASFITGELTVHPSDPTGRTDMADTAAFTVYRPESCTNEALTVYYALSGTATNGTHYTIAPASGSLVIAAGETNATVTVSPVWETDRADRTVILTLRAGAYALGGDPSATVTLAEVIAANPYTWYPRNPNLNWNEAQNWYGEAVPGSGQVALFDGQSSTEDCNINANISVGGILINNGYSGTITQESTRTVTIGSSGYTQHSGTFAGGDAKITINTGDFTLSGGSFTSTSGMLEMVSEQNYWTHSGGTFDANSGHVKMRGAWNDKTDISGDTTFYDWTSERWGGSAYVTIAADTTVTVENTFTMSFNDGREGGYSLNTGTVLCLGDIVATDGSRVIGGTATVRIGGAGDQTITGSGAGISNVEVDKPSGTLYAAGNLQIGNSFTLTAGTFTSTSGMLTLYDYTRAPGTTFNHNDGTVRFQAGHFETTTIDVPGSETFHHLIMAGSRSSYIELSGNTLTALGNFTFSPTDSYKGSSTRINDGIIRVHGNVTIDTLARGGTAQVQLIGAGEQTMTHVSGGVPPAGKWTIDKPSGTAMLASDFPLNGSGQDLDWTSGGLDVSSHTLTVNDDVTIGADATTLGVTVADATTAGRLTAGGTVSGLANAALAVTIAADDAEVTGQTYTILSNDTALGAEFGSVAWSDSWQGVVDYTDNAGKNIRLMDIRTPKGTMFILR